MAPSRLSPRTSNNLGKRAMLFSRFFGSSAVRFNKVAPSLGALAGMGGTENVRARVNSDDWIDIDADNSEEEKKEA